VKLIKPSATNEPSELAWLAIIEKWKLVAFVTTQDDAQTYLCNTKLLGLGEVLVAFSACTAVHEGARRP